MTMETSRTSKNYTKFRELLQTLFRMDQADLDFGIYRIMNQKRDEINRFLDNDLLPQVKAAFEQYELASKANLQGELEQAIQQARSLGADPDTLPRVQKLRDSLAEAVDVSAIEEQVFSHLANFFARYYDNGDFMSLRRYKEGVYAIPYEGEEVKLHWANADQYYVKTAENFTNYTFKLPDGRRVHFELVTASTEQNNVKEAEGRERRFVLDDVPLEERDGDLVVRFQYRPVEGRVRQDALNKETLESVFAQPGLDSWLRALRSPAPTERNKDRTVLEKHLNDYTARNTFDYFIHKDLGGFLRRELDFYIKNEVMHLDDIEHETAPKVEQYLSLIKVLRSIAHKIIAFLEQLENFQKKLWLKKKFVIETQYCITLDRVPEELYEEIAANDAQREEWVELFAIDEIEADLTTPGYSEPLTVEFLKANQELILDTRHFGNDFKHKLLDSIDDVDSSVQLLMVHGDNFQALSLLAEYLRGNVDLVYIDPPYNTPHSEILYKNSYRHSSWLSLINNTIPLVQTFPRERERFSFGASIDDYEFVRLSFLLEQAFPNYERSIVVVNHHPQGSGGRLSRTHEYLVFFSSARAPAYLGAPQADESEDRNFMRSGQAENNHRRGRWKSFYALLVDPVTNRIVGAEEPVPLGLNYPLGETSEGYRRMYPINSRGEERVWRSSYETGLRRAQAGELFLSDSGTVYQRVSHVGKRETLFSNWVGAQYNAGTHGTNLLQDMGLGGMFDYPKSLHTMTTALWAQSFGRRSALVLDYFAGSGTTGHALIHMNREHRTKHRGVLVEVGSHFDTATKPRILKAVYSPEWKDGRPLSRSAGMPFMLKYIRLESYEDTLNNLELTRSEQQARLLEANADLREEYMLSYMLDLETRGSQSLLNIEGFAKPDEYKLKIKRDGETRLVNVDLVETFNWLLGLRVKQMSVIRGVRVVDGVDPQGERVLILWRDVETMDNDALDKWFHRQQYSTRDLEYDVIYVNGDNNLENWRREDQTWKVRLIEDAFHRLMFDTNGL